MTEELDDKTTEFPMQEHSLLRNRVEEQIKAIHDLERYSVGGIVLIFAWLSTSHEQLGDAQYVWFLPPVFCGLAWYRAGALGKKLGRLAEYIQMLEAHLLSESTPVSGWETFMAREGPTGEKKSRTIFWTCLFVLTLAFSVSSYYIHSQHHEEQVSRVPQAEPTVLSQIEACELFRGGLEVEESHDTIQSV